MTATAQVTVVDQSGNHVYQPGFMYITFGHERAEGLQRPERSLLDDRVQLVVGEVEAIDEKTQTVQLVNGDRLGYDQLVLATGSRIVPEEIEHFNTEAHHFYTAEAALELREALDAFKGGRIVIGIAGMPYKCPPAPLEVAFLIEAELRQRGLRDRIARSISARRSAAPSRSSRSARWRRRSSSRRASSCTRSSTSRRSIRAQGRPEPRGRGAALRPADPGAAAPRRPVPDRLRPRARARRLAADRPPHLQVGGRPNVYALGDATDLPLSKAGSTAHFEAPIVAERIAAAVQGRSRRASTPTTRAG